MQGVGLGCACHLQCRLSIEFGCRVRVLYGSGSGSGSGLKFGFGFRLCSVWYLQCRCTVLSASIPLRTSLRAVAPDGPIRFSGLGLGFLIRVRVMVWTS